MGHIHKLMQDVEEGNARVITDINETFKFGCSQCGSCCMDNHTISITPWDVVRMSNELKIDALKFIPLCTFPTLGAQSRFPMLMLRPSMQIEGLDKTFCAFLVADINNPGKLKCHIQNGKPYNCAIFPLGKRTTIETDTGKVTVDYVVQEIDCNADKTNEISVKNWLALHNVSDGDKATQMLLDFTTKATDMLDFKLLADNGSMSGIPAEERGNIGAEIIIKMFGYKYNPNISAMDATQQLYDDTLAYIEEVVKKYPQLVPLT